MTDSEIARSLHAKQLEPQKVYREWRERMVQARIEKHGFEYLWKELYDKAS